MKKGFTVTITDNEKQQKVFDLNMDTLDFSITTELTDLARNHNSNMRVSSSTRAELKISGVVSKEQSDATVVSTIENTEFIDDEVTEKIECKHAWAEYTGLFGGTELYCINCGKLKD